MIAITRDVSDSLAKCELTHLSRVPIDVARARAQHAAYEAALGCKVVRLPAEHDMPDSVFIEDAAVVLDDVAIICRPGAESRRRETAAVAQELAKHRRLESIVAPGTVDGGDVLVIGRDVFVGRTKRTNADGIRQLQALLPGRTVVAVNVTGCLHLKSAATAIDASTLLINPQWVAPGAFAPYEMIEVDPAEPHAANVLRLPDRLLFSVAYPRTLKRLPGKVVTVEADELAKAEGALTCCSLLVS